MEKHPIPSPCIFKPCAFIPRRGWVALRRERKKLKLVLVVSLFMPDMLAAFLCNRDLREFFMSVKWIECVCSKWLTDVITHFDSSCKRTECETICDGKQLCYVRKFSFKKIQNYFRITFKRWFIQFKCLLILL